MSVLVLVTATYFPGSLFLDLCRWDQRRYLRLPIAFAAGLALSSMAYQVVRYLHAERVFPLLLVICAGFYFHQLRRRLIEQQPAPMGRPPLSNVLPIAFALIAIFALLHASHFSDAVPVEGGGVSFKAGSESIYHLGLVNVLSQTFPPFFPYLSGTPLSYHIDMHMFAEMLSRFGGVSTITAVYRILPAFLFLLLVFVPAVLFYNVTQSVFLSIFFGLSMFAADLSFLPFLFNSVHSFPWTLAFCTTIWSIFIMNGALPGLVLFWSSVVALQRFFLTRRVGNLVVFSLFAISAARMKSSEIQIVSCAALTALIIWLAYRDRDGLKLLVSSFACAAVAGASLLSMGDALSSSQRMVLAWDPWNGLRESARILHFPLENGLQHLLYLGIYVLGYLGMRVVAIRYISATTTRDGNYLFLFLGIFIVSGCLLSEFIYLGNPERSYNNAVWFRVQSIIAATFFVIYFIYEQKTRRRQLLWSLLFVAISIPSTLNFLWLEGRGTQVRVSGSQMEVVEYMRKNLHHNAVIMEPPDQERPSLAANLAGRQSVISLFFSFLPSQAPISELRERLVDVTRFFKNELSTEERLRLYDKYGITHVLAPSAKAEALKGFPELHLLFGSSEATIFSRTR